MVVENVLRNIAGIKAENEVKGQVSKAKYGKVKTHPGDIAYSMVKGKDLAAEKIKKIKG